MGGCVAWGSALRVVVHSEVWLLSKDVLLLALICVPSVHVELTLFCCRIIACLHVTTISSPDPFISSKAVLCKHGRGLIYRQVVIARIDMLGSNMGAK